MDFTDKKDDENLTSEELSQEIIRLLEDKKIENIIPLNLKGKTILTDFIIIGSGTSNKHIGSVAELIREKFKKHVRHMEGVSNSDWAIVDAQGVIVHLFKSEARTLYNLEKMWTGNFNSEKDQNE